MLGPALRAQPDRRLVTLVREGYDAAFEEIVRRYRRPLDRFAASFVGGRSEDVIQDSLSKALSALRGSEKEIELRPWLYRIVRNTALNELRDRPPSVEQLEEALAGGRSTAAEAESREEIAELMARLRALPEPQRAAIVMRELEGLSHEEIAANLGLSGGAARQTIYRARAALRTGFGALLPLPLLRALFDHGAEAAAGGAAAAGGTGVALGALGGGTAVKAGLATVLVAGSIGAGVAYEQNQGGRGPERAEAAVTRTAEADASAPVTRVEADPGSSDSSGPGSGFEPGDDHRSGRGSDRDGDEDRSGRSDRGRDHSASDRSSGSGGSSGSGSGDADDGFEDSSGHRSGSSSGSSGHGGSDDSGSSSDSGSRRSSSGSGSGDDSSGSGSRSSGDSSSGSGSRSGGSGSSGGSGEEVEVGDDSSGSGAPPAPVAEPEVDGEDSGSGDSSGSGSSGGGTDDG